MKTIVIEILTVLTLLASCRAIKVAEEIKTAESSSTKNEVRQSSTTHDLSVDSSKITGSTFISDTTSEVITETFYSEPDSVGKQYPLSIRTTERSSCKKVNSHSIRQNNTTYVADSTGSSVDKSRTDKKESQEVNESRITKSRTPSWVWIPVVIISLGLVFLGYLVLKRFMLIK